MLDISKSLYNVSESGNFWRIDVSEPFRSFEICQTPSLSHPPPELCGAVLSLKQSFKAEKENGRVRTSGGEEVSSFIKTHVDAQLDSAGTSRSFFKISLLNSQCGKKPSVTGNQVVFSALHGLLCITTVIPYVITCMHKTTENAHRQTQNYRNRNFCKR